MKSFLSHPKKIFVKRSISYKPGSVYVVIYLGLMSPQASSVYHSLSEQPKRLFFTCFEWSLQCSSYHYELGSLLHYHFTITIKAVYFLLHYSSDYSVKMLSCILLCEARTFLLKNKRPLANAPLIF